MWTIPNENNHDFLQTGKKKRKKKVYKSWQKKCELFYRMRTKCELSDRSSSPAYFLHNAYSREGPVRLLTNLREKKSY